MTNNRSLLAIVAALALAPVFLLVSVALTAEASGTLSPAATAPITTCGSGPVRAGAGTDGYPALDASQIGNAQIVYNVAEDLQLPPRAPVIAIAAALQESTLRNLPYGSADSLGLFQQRPSQGWGSPAQLLNPVYASSAFYARLIQVTGWQTLPLTVAAQDVQRSGDPGAYAHWESLADALVSTFSGTGSACLNDNGGHVPASGTTQLPAGFALPAGTPAAVQAAISYAVAQLGKPYVFSGGPDGQIMLNPRVCPAQKADVNNSSGATGVVQATLDAEQRCAAAAVILYAAEQLGKPYQWGGTGPDAFDCSGLAMMAYRAAGLAIPRTSQEQWAVGPRVSDGQEQSGDLAFFSGSDGTPQSPGHVGIVIGTGEMIEAYAPGFPVRVSTFGQPTSPPGDQVVVGFTRPLG